jgi:hypothetical protein
MISRADKWFALIDSGATPLYQEFIEIMRNEVVPQEYYLANNPVEEVQNSGGCCGSSAFVGYMIRIFNNLFVSSNADVAPYEVEEDVASVVMAGIPNDVN